MPKKKKTTPITFLICSAIRGTTRYSSTASRPPRPNQRRSPWLWAARQRAGLAARYSLMIPPHVRRSTRSKPLVCSTSRIVAGGTHWSIVSQ